MVPKDPYYGGNVEHPRTKPLSDFHKEATRGVLTVTHINYTERLGEIEGASISTRIEAGCKTAKNTQITGATFRASASKR